MILTQLQQDLINDGLANINQEQRYSRNNCNIESGRYQISEGLENNSSSFSFCLSPLEPPLRSPSPEGEA